MLKKIVSISGKPGLYRVISQGKNMLIVESLVDKKRLPAYTSDKVVSLGDISMFTVNEDKPLAAILELVKAKENGAQASIDPKSEASLLKDYFAAVLPDYDRNRVYPTDIKKLIQWYNLLISTGNTNFSLEKESDDDSVSESEA
jgi:hypothetical protein